MGWRSKLEIKPEQLCESTCAFLIAHVLKYLSLPVTAEGEANWPGRLGKKLPRLSAAVDEELQSPSGLIQ